MSRRPWYSKAEACGIISRVSGNKLTEIGEQFPQQKPRKQRNFKGFWLRFMRFNRERRRRKRRGSEAGKCSLMPRDFGITTIWLCANTRDASNYDCWSVGVCDDIEEVDEAKSKLENRIEIKARETVDSSRFRVVTQSTISSVPIIVPGRKHPSTAVRTTDFNKTFLSMRFIPPAIKKSKCLTLRAKIRVCPVTPWVTFYTRLLTFSISRWCIVLISGFFSGMLFVTPGMLTKL